jgi:hypothetical protein
MQGVEVLHTSEDGLDRFLYASVGDDRNGSAVTVVSAFARLGLDPWKEAAELAVLGQEAARVRLGTLLSRFKDVPALGLEHGAVAERLALLLPERLSHRVSKLVGPKTSKSSRIPIVWSLAFLFVILALARVFFLAHSG